MGNRSPTTLAFIKQHYALDGEHVRRDGMRVRPKLNRELGYRMVPIRLPNEERLLGYWRFARLKLYLRDGAVPMYVMNLDGDPLNDSFANIRSVSQVELQAYHRMKRGADQAADEALPFARRSFVLKHALEKFELIGDAVHVMLPNVLAPGGPAPTFIDSKGYRRVYIGTFRGHRVDWPLARLKVALATRRIPGRLTYADEPARKYSVVGTRKR